MAIRHKTTDAFDINSINNWAINSINNDIHKTDNNINKYSEELTKRGQTLYNYFIACQYIYRANLNTIKVLVAMLSQFGYKKEVSNMLNVYGMGAIVNGNADNETQGGTKTVTMFSNVKVVSSEISKVSSKNNETNMNVLSSDFNAEYNDVIKKYDKVLAYLNSNKNKATYYLNMIRQYNMAFTNMNEVIRKLNGLVNGCTGEDSYKLEANELTCTYNVEDTGCNEACGENSI